MCVSESLCIQLIQQQLSCRQCWPGSAGTAGRCGQALQEHTGSRLLLLQHRLGSRMSGSVRSTGWTARPGQAALTEIGSNLVHNRNMQQETEVPAKKCIQLPRRWPRQELDGHSALLVLAIARRYISSQQPRCKVSQFGPGIALERPSIGKTAPRPSSFAPVERIVPVRGSWSCK
jgi:hypothetical protein